jgi:propane monooxygenase coupling protein
VGAVDRMDVDYDEISEALARTRLLRCGSSHTKSTQCGRVIHEDDWTIMFANLQDAAG